jgi:hypothetical protein
MMKINEKRIRPLLLLVFLSITIWASISVMAAEPIKIGLIQGLGGPLDVYARQEIAGFTLGLEYATQGTNKIIEKDVKLIIEETQSKPEKAVTLLTKLYQEDRVDLLPRGPGGSSGRTHQQCRGTGLSTSGQKIRADPYRRTGCRRFHYRCPLESLYLQDRS